MKIVNILIIAINLTLILCSNKKIEVNDIKIDENLIFSNSNFQHLNTNYNNDKYLSDSNLSYFSFNLNNDHNNYFGNIMNDHFANNYNNILSEKDDIPDEKYPINENNNQNMDYNEIDKNEELTNHKDSYKNSYENNISKPKTNGLKNDHVQNEYEHNNKLNNKEILDKVLKIEPEKVLEVASANIDTHKIKIEQRSNIIRKQVLRQNEREIRYNNVFVSNKSILKNEKILVFPKNKILSSKYKVDIGSNLEENHIINENIDEISITLKLLENYTLKNMFLYDYGNIFQTNDFSLNLLWSKDFIEMYFKGSQYKDLLLHRQDQLKDEYKYLVKNNFIDKGKVSMNKYIEVRFIVSQQHIHISKPSYEHNLIIGKIKKLIKPKILAIPMISFFALSDQPNCRLIYKNFQIEIKAISDIKPGIPLTISLGSHSNMENFLFYGFTFSSLEFKEFAKINNNLKYKSFHKYKNNLKKDNKSVKETSETNNSTIEELKMKKVIKGDDSSEEDFKFNILPSTVYLDVEVESNTYKKRNKYFYNIELKRTNSLNNILAVFRKLILASEGKYEFDTSSIDRISKKYDILEQSNLRFKQKPEDIKNLVMEKVKINDNLIAGQYPINMPLDIENEIHSTNLMLKMLKTRYKMFSTSYDFDRSKIIQINKELNTFVASKIIKQSSTIVKNLKKKAKLKNVSFKEIISDSEDINDLNINETKFKDNISNRDKLSIYRLLYEEKRILLKYISYINTINLILKRSYYEMNQKDYFSNKNLNPDKINNLQKGMSDFIKKDNPPIIVPAPSNNKLFVQMSNDLTTPFSIPLEEKKENDKDINSKNTSSNSSSKQTQSNNNNNDPKQSSIDGSKKVENKEEYYKPFSFLQIRPNNLNSKTEEVSTNKPTKNNISYKEEDEEHEMSSFEKEKEKDESIENNLDFVDKEIESTKEETSSNKNVYRQNNKDNDQLNFNEDSIDNDYDEDENNKKNNINKESESDMESNEKYEFENHILDDLSLANLDKNRTNIDDFVSDEVLAKIASSNYLSQYVVKMIKLLNLRSKKLEHYKRRILNVGIKFFRDEIGKKKYIEKDLNNDI